MSQGDDVWSFLPEGNGLQLAGATCHPHRQKKAGGQTRDMGQIDCQYFSPRSAHREMFPINAACESMKVGDSLRWTQFSHWYLLSAAPGWKTSRYLHDRE